MTPVARIRKEYQDRPESHTFEWYLNWHMDHGFVFSTPSFFIMGFAVDSDLVRKVEPMAAFRAKGDCWYIAAMAGDMVAAWSILPWKLPLLAWHRDRDGGKDLQIWPIEKIERLTKGGKT